MSDYILLYIVSEYVLRYIVSEYILRYIVSEYVLRSLKLHCARLGTGTTWTAYTDRSPYAHTLITHSLIRSFVDSPRVIH